MNVFVRPGDAKAQKVYRSYCDDRKYILMFAGGILGLVIGFSVELFTVDQQNVWLPLALAFLLVGLGFVMAYYVRCGQNYGKMKDAGRIMEVDDTSANLINAIIVLIDNDTTARKLAAYNALLDARGSVDPHEADAAVVAACRDFLKNLDGQPSNNH